MWTFLGIGLMVCGGLYALGAAICVFRNYQRTRGAIPSAGTLWARYALAQACYAFLIAAGGTGALDISQPARHLLAGGAVASVFGWMLLQPRGLPAFPFPFRCEEAYHSALQSYGDGGGRANEQGDGSSEGSRVGR